MPNWEEYKAIAKSRGALAWELYVAQTIPAGDPEAVKANLSNHLAYQADLESQGVLVMAGPVSDESGDEMMGAGQIIYRAESLSAAKAFADADPMHMSGARTYTMRKWLVNEGNLSVTFGLSGQTIRLE